MPLLWTVSDFTGFYFTPDLGDIQGLSCVTSTFSCDEDLESAVWVTTSRICRACPWWTTREGQVGKLKDRAFALGKCLQRSVPPESHLSYQTGCQILSCSSLPTWSTKTIRSKQQTNQPTNKQALYWSKRKYFSVYTSGSCISAQETQIHP